MRVVLEFISDMLDNTFDKVKYSKSDFPDANIWMELLRTEVEKDAMNGSSMGSLEKLIEKRIKELALPMLRYGAQLIADHQEMICPVCGTQLQVEEHERERTVKSVFGDVLIERSYGFCKTCEKPFYPADKTLGLHERATASPRVQEISSLSVLQAPAGQMSEDVRRMTGLDLTPSTLHREARRQGERALRLREKDVELTNTVNGVKELCKRAQSSANDSGYTIVIEIDAWNIRERDNWGMTKELIANGEDTKRWHWVYSGTVFRLDHRGESDSGRSFITERGYVATRKGVDALEKQLYAEALQRGLQNAKSVLVIADGAVWIWNLAENRFKDAIHRVDIFHVSEHLWAVANDLFDKGTPEATKWAKKHISYLKLREKGSLDVITSLCEIRDNLGGLTKKQKKTVEREIGYFNRHKNKMDYKNGRKLKQPIGSGAMESTCAQYQCRFKRTGQFWSLDGDEAFLALQTLHWNKRWHLLFPHDRQKE